MLSCITSQNLILELKTIRHWGYVSVEGPQTNKSQLSLKFVLGIAKWPPLQWSSWAKGEICDFKKVEPSTLRRSALEQPKCMIMKQRKVQAACATRRQVKKTTTPLIGFVGHMYMVWGCKCNFVQSCMGHFFFTIHKRVCPQIAQHLKL
jgi:hypothetical protein